MSNPDVHSSLASTEKAADRSQIDYASAVNGGLQLVPAGDGAKALEEDYARMIEDGPLEDAEPFAALMERCADKALYREGVAVRRAEVAFEHRQTCQMLESFGNPGPPSLEQIGGGMSRWTPCGHHAQSEKGRLAAAFS